MYDKHKAVRHAHAAQLYLLIIGIYQYHYIHKIPILYIENNVIISQ